MGVYVRAAVPPGSYQVQIVAADMCCKGCVQKVAGQLYAAPGVTEVNANLENRTVVVTVSQKKRIPATVASGRGRYGRTNPAHHQRSHLYVTPPESLDKSQILPATKSHIIVEDLNFEGREQKIANQLYTTEGVIKVSADAAAERFDCYQPTSSFTMGFDYCSGKSPRASDCHRRIIRTNDDRVVK